MIEVTHKSRCDQNTCSNYNIDFNVSSIGGVYGMVFCAGCHRDITYTVTPI